MKVDLDTEADVADMVGVLLSGYTTGDRMLLTRPTHDPDTIEIAVADEWTGIPQSSYVLKVTKLP